MQSDLALSKLKGQKQWDLVKEDIRKHYLQAGKTLEEVRQLISSQHDFDACERAYKARLKKWGFTTYRKKNSIFVTPQVKRRCQRRASKITKMPCEDQSALEKGFLSFQLASITTKSSDLARSSISYQPCHTSLHLAVIDECVADVMWYTRDGRDVRSHDENGLEPLHYAVMGDNTTIVVRLLECGADHYAEGAQSKQTPLEMALLNPASLNALLENETDVCKPNADGKSLLHLLCAFDLDTYAEGAISFGLLVDAGADVNQSDGSVSPFHMLLSKTIASDGSPTCQVLKKALLAGAYPTGYHQSKESAQYRTPFEMFLDKAMMINWGRPSNNSCLAEIFKLFLEKGADPNIRLSNGHLIFDHFWEFYRTTGEAVYHDILEVLLQKMDLSLAFDHPLGLLGRLVSTRFPAVELMELALKRGCSVNVETGLSKSSLTHIAYSPPIGEQTPVEEKIARVKLLLKHGAEVFWPLSLGKMPLEAFLEKDEAWADEVVNLILEADADNPNSDPTNLPKWCIRWRRAVRCRSWAPAAHDITLVDRQSWPFQDASRLQRLALKSLAHRHLRVQRENFGTKRISYQQHEEEVNLIIRDCRALKVDIPEKWIGYAAVLFNQDFE